MIITNSRYALVGYFITSYPTRAHGIIVIYDSNIEGNTYSKTQNVRTKNQLKENSTFFSFPETSFRTNFLKCY